MCQISPDAAGRWLLHSGIRRDCGGFSRYYDATSSRYRAVSTEITGYAASALVWLFERTGHEEYLEAARQTAEFLLNAWDPELRTFPFEHPSPSSESEHLSYFFDSGIIIRGLLAVWHQTREERILETARTAALSMAEDFRAHHDYHPILHLPEKAAAARRDGWSRNAGCYQLKAALAWRDVACISGDAGLKSVWSEMLSWALSEHVTFLPGSTCEHKVMDRLHPYCYFLEGLLPELDRPEIQEIYRKGLQTVSQYLNKVAPTFCRSDVYAQLLRARLNAATRIAVDAGEACAEASHLGGFQMESADPRIDGGFIFGRRENADILHVNPVSTVFAVQALDQWRDYQVEGSKSPCLPLLI